MRKVRWCDEDQSRSEGNWCPECQYVLPCAKAEILKQLHKIGVVTLQEMMTFLTDKQGDVAKFAKEHVLQVAARDASLLSALLAKVAASELDIAFLGDLSALPTEQRLRATADFLKLINPSQSGSLRANALLHLASGWAPRNQVVKIATDLLTDETPSIRTQALRTLRAAVAV